MAQTAILGAGVMGETLLSGLVRAGRRVDHLLVGEKRADRAARTMSQARAILAPAPAATPFTAQTTGFVRLRINRRVGL